MKGALRFFISSLFLLFSGFVASSQVAYNTSKHSKIMVSMVSNTLEISKKRIWFKRVRVYAKNACIQHFDGRELSILPDTSARTVNVFLVNPWRKRDTVRCQYKVVEFPLPEVFVAYKQGGTIRKDELAVQQAVFARQNNQFVYFAGEWKTPVVSYKCMVFKEDNTYKFFQLEGELISKELKMEFEKLQKGERVLFYDIYAKVTDVVKLPSTLLFEIN